MPATFDPVLLIDGHNLLCRSCFVFQSLQTTDGRFLGGLYGFIKSFLRIAGFYQGSYRPIICWDMGRSVRRMTLAPDYKDRPRMDTLAEPIPNQVEFAKQACEAMGILSLQLKGVEADDIIAVLSHLSRMSIIYSNDKDFFQLVREGHVLRRPGKNGDVIYNYLTQEHFTGLKARLYLALMGDKVDNIPGVKGVGETTAQNLLNALETHPSLSFNDACEPNREPVEILRLVEEALVEKRKGIRNWRNVTQHWESFLKSLELVDLWRKDLLTEGQLLEVLEGLSREIQPDWNKLQSMFDDWEFNISIPECKSMVLGESVDLDDLWEDDEDPEGPTVEEAFTSVEEVIASTVAGAGNAIDALLESFDDVPEDVPEGVPKAQYFALKMGYVEDAALTNLFLSHDEGFPSVEEALEDFGKVLLEILTQEQEERNTKFVQICPHCKQMLSPTLPPDVYQVMGLFQEIFRGTLDSVGLMWEHFENAGWNLSPELNYQALAQLVCVPDNAAILIGAATFPDDPPDSWCTWDDILVPEGVQVRKQL